MRNKINPGDTSSADADRGCAVTNYSGVMYLSGWPTADEGDSVVSLSII